MIRRFSGGLARLRRITGPDTDLAMVLLIALFALLPVVFDIPTILRVPFTLPLVTIVPGYVLVATLFPGRSLSLADLALLSVGCSVAITMLVGLVLAVTVGLTGFTWTITMTMLVLAGVVVARHRRAHSTPNSVQRLSTVRWRDAASIALAGLAMVAIILGTRTIATAQQSAAPEQLWILPVSSSPYDVRIGIRGGISADDYRLTLTSGSNLLDDFHLKLDPEQSWQILVHLQPEDRQEALFATLYREGEDAALRFVVLQPAS